jgi:XTP/dITP diphosphohydrolase
MLAGNTLVLATGNLSKVTEFATLLAPLGWHVQSQAAWHVPESPEPYGTFIENALTKARHAARHTGLPALADDSGLCVNALGNLPGVYSARYACDTPTTPKSDADNNRKLLHELNDLQCVSAEQRRAYFVCVLVALKDWKDPEPLISIGRWQGFIANNLSGDNGFGYDPLFVCAQTQRVSATLSTAEKSRISHRGLAAQHMLHLIQTHW